MSGNEALQVQKDRFRKRLLNTRRAFRILPRMDGPRILDVGCGSGVPTLELARLCGGEVVGIDIDELAIHGLAQKTERCGLSGRVTVLKCSLADMDFPDASFDVIWAEGSTHILGFEISLKEWRRLLKRQGFLVTHEMIWSRPDPPREAFRYWKKLAASGIRTVPEYLDAASGCGYDVVRYFPLAADAWWTEYYAPLKEKIRVLRRKYRNDKAVLQIINKEQREIESSGKYRRWYGSVFIILQKSHDVPRQAKAVVGAL